MNIYGIYDIKEKEQCVRVGTLQEIVKFLSLTARELDRALKTESTVKNKYIFYLRRIQKNARRKQVRISKTGIKRIQR